MASVRQFVLDKLSRFGLTPADSELDALLFDAGILVDGYEANYDDTTKQAARQAIYNGLSELLAMPDITEGGMSIKYDRVAIATYCNHLRTELGLPDPSAPTVSDASFRW